MVGPLLRIRDIVLGKCFKRGSKKVSNRAGGCGGCGGCTFLRRLLRDLVQIKLQPPQPPQPPARFDTFLEHLFKYFLRTVSRILQKGPTKLAPISLPSANTLALSAPHSRAIYGSSLVGKVRELLLVQGVRGVLGRGRGSHEGRRDGARAGDLSRRWARCGFELSRRTVGRG